MSGHTPGRLYADRDIIQQGKHYTDHVRAMTAEGLHSKSDIAAELAHRDIQRDELLAALKMWLALHDTPVGLVGKHGRALGEAITARQFKVDEAASASRAAIAKVES